MNIKEERLKEIIREELEKMLLGEMASFGRTKARIEEKKEPFAMITAFRGGLDLTENLARQKELESAVKAEGFSWNKMPGSGYVEKPERIPLAYNEVKENSILIWEEAKREDVPKSGVRLKKLATDLARRFEQDSFIYGEPVTGETSGTSMSIKAYDQEGNQITEDWAGPWSTLHAVDNAAAYWSTIAGKKGQLREMKKKYEKEKSGSFMGAVKRQHYIKAATSGLKWIDNRRQK